MISAWILLKISIEVMYREENRKVCFHVQSSFSEEKRSRPSQSGKGGKYLGGVMVVAVTAASAVAGAACAVFACLVIFPHGAAGQACAQNYDC